MRSLVLFILLGLLAGTGLAQEKVVQTFSGTAAETTAPFTGQAKGEVRWQSAAFLTVVVLASDGSIVAGGSATTNGSLYLPKGGTFSLRIVRYEQKPLPWNVSVVVIGNEYAYEPASIAVATNVIISVASAAPPTPAAVPASPMMGNLTEDEAHAVVVIKGDVAEGTG